MTLTKPQKRLLRWLVIADDYSRRVWGAELRTARELAGLGHVILEYDDGDWFATHARLAAEGRREEAARYAKVGEELERAVSDPQFFDDGASSLTWTVFFGAKVEHGLSDEDWPDVYSYAMEAAEALSL